MRGLQNTLLFNSLSVCFIYTQKYHNTFIKQRKMKLRGFKSHYFSSMIPMNFPTTWFPSPKRQISFNVRELIFKRTSFDVVINFMCKLIKIKVVYLLWNQKYFYTEKINLLKMYIDYLLILQFCPTLSKLYTLPLTSISRETPTHIST